jgi:phosphatidylethanolamine-binding protein (PEBP) family uncharacterized protein
MSTNVPRLVAAALSLALTLGLGAPTAAAGATPPPPKAAPGSLAVTRVGNGTVISNPTGIDCGTNCSAIFADKSNVILNATPAPGYAFAGWSGICTGIGRCTVKIAGQQGLTATFAALDKTPPLVRSFTVPATVKTLTVPITSFVASDDQALAGYLITLTKTQPLASVATWTVSPPTAFTAISAGRTTLYAWAKDRASNVSQSVSATVVIDTAAPIVSEFTVPAQVAGLTIPVKLNATDDTAVVGYLITETATSPSLEFAGWQTTKPTSFQAAAAGAKTLYAWARDAAGNISSAKSASCTLVPEGPGGGMNIANTISDQAQSTTIAFDGLAFVTGSYCAQTFYPPGKVADFFGFQFLRDNDPSGMGHNTDFTTLTADPVLVLLNDAQLTTLSDLGTAEAGLNEAYGYARLPLADAFRRLIDGDTPSGHPELSREAVKAFSADLFGIDGQMSYLRAKAYASVLGSMDTGQQATLAAMRGKGALAWPQPTQSAVDAVLKKYPNRMMRTYAGEMLAWYLGSEDADVYFCPERQGTYFGSFFMKDIKAMNNPSYTIDSNMTANMGNSFLAMLDTAQQVQITGLVTTQKPDLLAIVAKRDEIAKTLRQFLQQGAVVEEAAVVNLARQYGELDGEISYYYATNFSAVGNSLTASQYTNLMALRKTATAESGGTPDYDNQCGNGYLYSAPMPSDAPPLMDTDFLFGACKAEANACSTDWDCCSFSCSDNNVCTAPFKFSSPAFQDGGILPITYTCEDAQGGVSPPLAWTGVPQGTVEFALTASTLAVDGKKWNWVLYGIPASVTALAANTSGIGTTGASTDGPDLKFYPPCSSGAGQRTYTFTLYALSGKPTFSTSPVTGEVLADAIGPLTIGSRQMSVNYTFATGH